MHMLWEAEAMDGRIKLYTGSRKVGVWSSLQVEAPGVARRDFFGLQGKTSQHAATVICCGFGGSGAWLGAVPGSGTSSTWIPVSGKPSTLGAAVEEIWPF